MFGGLGEVRSHSPKIVGKVGHGVLRTGPKLPKSVVKSSSDCPPSTKAVITAWTRRLGYADQALYSQF